MSAHVITSSRRLQGLIQLMFGEDTSVRFIDEIIRYLQYVTKGVLVKGTCTLHPLFKLYPLSERIKLIDQ